jgi:hypothetical protein
MNARLLLGSAFGAVASIVVACSSSSTPAPPDSTVSEFCADWAKAYCQISNLCQFDANACTTHQTSVCNSFAQTAQQSGTRQYSQSNGKACIDALNDAYGTSLSKNGNQVPASTLLTLEDTCNRAFVGSAAENANCSSDYDCANDLICGKLPGAATGQCGKKTSKSLNDPCADPGDTCTGSSYCSAATGSLPKCVSTPPVGGACSASIPCGDSARCVNGVCAARAAQGQTCGADSDCGSGLYCDTYAPAECVTALGFARGSTDCQGIAGTDTATTPDSGVTVNDSGGAQDSGSAQDAASE